MVYTTTCPSPLGTLTIAATDSGITGLWLQGQKYFGAGLPAQARQKSPHPALKDATRWLERYWAGKKPAPADIPLAPGGTPFRQRVWAILCQIPYGEVVTYGDIAKQLAAEDGKPTMSGQAVGGAVGHNPVSIIIPCHRVVGGNGSLTGYAGGVAAKIHLLTHEGADMRGLYAPKTGTAL